MPLVSKKHDSLYGRGWYHCTQRKITIAFFMLHNFIRKEGLSNEYCTQYNEPNVTFRNNNVCIDNNEYKVATHDTIADR